MQKVIEQVPQKVYNKKIELKKNPEDGKMDNMQEQKKEAMQAAGEYLEKLIPGMGTLCEELKGDRKEDTNDFRKQCIDGLNWIIEIYNRTSDMIDAEKLQINKETLNETLKELGGAITAGNDGKTAELLEGFVVPFLKNLKEAFEN